ncbi:PAS domain-containing protein [Roseicella sp. DB1501]|uniref:sensor histidine kinase n=1 Tax=Roseicella sp. DB1501 TaxID=2730925 RepID=UPI001490A526|nr:PAS domain-containing protein [Roseicella sp. DB1501]NOG70332.1 PAS domain-containing protein [Roseicella sp. DB1501]
MPEDSRSDLPDIECIRGFAEESPMAVLVLEGAGQVIRFANRAFLAAVARPEAALRDRPLAAALPEPGAALLAMLEEVHATGVARRVEALPLRLDGRAARRWDIELSAIRADGAVAGALALLRDVTEREAQAERYRALVEVGALAVWIAGPDGAVLENASWAAVTGLDPATVSGKGWQEAIHPEDRARAAALWQASVMSGEVYEVEYRLRRADGTWRWSTARAVPRRDEDGRILEWVGANADTEARQLAEQALRASEDRFRTLAEAMPHLVWQTDAAGRMEYVNRRWRALTGLGLAPLAEAGWMAALHPEDAARLAPGWAAALAGGGEYDADARIRTAEGEDRWHRVRAASVRDAAGRIHHWVGTCTDVEERHQAEARLREALAMQERLLREAEHRIKNSLQLVAALLRLQSGRMPEPAAREALEAATARVQAVAEAHRALQMSPDLRSVRLSDMLRELAAGASVQHPGCDIRIAAPETLALDAERAIPLALILSELVTDALRRERPPGAEHPIRLEARLEAERLVVTVADGGTLLPQDLAAGRMGETVVRALARQIGAEVATEENADGDRHQVTLRMRLEPG